VITVKTLDGDKTDHCVVTVNPQISGVSLNKNELALVEGSSEQLTVAITPSDAYNKSVTWNSKNPNIATVTNTGLVEAISPGTAIITVTTQEGERTATCYVTVTSPIVSVTGVLLNESTLSLSKTETKTLIAIILPENASNKTVTWTSNNAAVASVNATGLVTALAHGVATITATTQDGSKAASCIVTVTIPVASISLNKTSLTLTVGETSVLASTVLPEVASNKTVNWTSSNDAIATVDNTGQVSAIAPGSATIIATTQDGGKTASCNVTVNPLIIPATNISLNHTTLTIEGSHTGTLTATVLPVNATNNSVIWSSSDITVATVSDGVITPVPPSAPTGARTVTITATSDDVSTIIASCTVTINYVPVTGVTLPTSLSLNIGDIERLTPIIAPANASIKTVTWSTSNPNIVAVSNGNLLAGARGSATITALSVAAPTISGTCTVTVNP